MAKKKKVAPKKKQEDVFVQKPSLTTGGPVKDGVRQIGQRRLGGKIVTT